MFTVAAHLFSTHTTHPHVVPPIIAEPALLLISTLWHDSGFQINCYFVAVGALTSYLHILAFLCFFILVQFILENFNIFQAKDPFAKREMKQGPLLHILENNFAD